MTAPPGEAGSATVWVVAAIAVIVTALGLALALGEIATAQGRAAAAADAAALAAAAVTIDGPDLACDRARTLAQLNDAELTGCTPAGAVVSVTVAVRLPGVLARFGHAVGRARAGPVSVALDRPPSVPLRRTSEG